jgi:hypothetical protein
MVALPYVVPGAIAGYSDLVGAVGDWLNRDDLVSQIPAFIALAEARFNRELRTLWQTTRLTFTATVSGNTLPTDFRKMTRLSVSDLPNRPLFEVSPQAAAQRFDGSTGEVRSYYIEARNLFLLPPPDGAVTLDMTYLAAIPPLTSGSQTNWLLTEHPDAYLFSTMLEAAIYIRDQEAAQYLADRTSEIIAAIRRQSRLDMYGGGPIVPQAPLQVRGGRC